MYSGSQNGFTLLEIMVIILILGIIVGVAVPSIQGPLAHYKLFAAGREMVAEIREIQQRALTEEKHSFRIWFLVDRSRSFEVDSYLIMDGMNTVKTVELPVSINLYETNFAGERLYISCSGYPAHGFGGTIQLENDNDERLYIIVAKTGRVRMDTTPPSASLLN